MPTCEMFPYLCVHDAGKAIAFYTEAFGMRELFRLTEPSGRIGHAELDFHGATLMLADEFPECGIRSASAIGATPVTIHLHVDNCDQMIERAVQAGATLEMAPADAFYGERSGVVRDPFGHRWNIGHPHRGCDAAGDAAALYRAVRKRQVIGSVE